MKKLMRTTSVKLQQFCTLVLIGNHVGEVATILHACFDWLPHSDGIFQGDFIGFGGSDEYTPNTITYKFPTVIQENIIIAPHTFYIAESDLRDAIAYPMDFIITDTFYCKFVKPRARIFSGDYIKCAGNFSDLSEVIDFAKVMAQNVHFVNHKQAKEITKQLNKCIRENTPIDDNAFDCDYTLIAFWKLVKSIKDDALYLCRNDGPAAYIGQEQIDSEGYVWENQFGTYKLIVSGSVMLTSTTLSSKQSCNHSFVITPVGGIMPPYVSPGVYIKPWVPYKL
jgi:hypothetical protein